MKEPPHSEPTRMMAEVVTIATLVDYKERSTVTPENPEEADRLSDSVRLRRREGLSEHTVPFDALVQVIDGEAEITVSGKSHRVASGEMILMPANQPHALKALQRYKMILTRIQS